MDTARLTRRAFAGLMAGAAALPFTARAATDRKSLRVLLDWYVNPNHVPVILADKLGFFADAGMTVEIIEPADPNDPPKLVAAGQGDVAISYMPQLMMQVDQGLPLKRIGALIPTPLNTLMALKGGAVASIADLRGKKIGNSVGGFEDALLGAMLKSAGLALSDVTLVNVNFALAQSLMSGAVDAVIGAYRNYETHILALEGKEALAFFPEEHGVPTFEELIFVARPDADAVKLTLFLMAIQRGVEVAGSIPDEAWKYYIAGRPQLDDEINKRAFASTLNRFAARPADADPERYAAFSRFLFDGGVIGAARPPSDYIWLPGG